MTAPETTRESAGNRIFLGGAIALIAVVAVLVFLFGIVRPPALAALSLAGPAPSGGVAFVQWDGEQGCAELRIVRPDGSSPRSACELDGGDVVGWTTAGIQVYGWMASAMSGPTLRVYDPATAEVKSEGGSEADLQATPSEGVTVLHGRDGVLTVSSANSRTTLWTVRADGRYSVNWGSRSPDGEWFALIDTSGRLLLVPADGSAPPVVWSTDGPENSWPGPVWEGTEPQDVGGKSG